MTPVLLGEALVARVLETAPALPTRLLKDASGSQAKRALAVLTQSTRAHPSVEQALRRALSDHLALQWPAALEVAQATGDPLGRLLALTLEQTPQRELAARIEAALPKQTVALRELAVTATGQALEQARQRAPSVERDSEIARLANNQSTNLTQLGRREQALAAIEEAVEILRGLAEARPDVFLPPLATSLNNHSNRLAELGRREQALAAIEEAVEIRRGLAEARPDAFLPDLAESVNNQSNRLGDLGRREQALAAIEQAVEIYRRLAEARPDAFLPRLAGSVDNQSVRLAQRGRREQALAAIEEAVEIFRGLAEARPDAFLPPLAKSLNNQSIHLAQRGRREQALAAIEEAVEIYRGLADARPDAFLPNLAKSLNNQSNRLTQLGRHEQALAAMQEAIERILPMLERTPYVLPDSGRSLVQQYLRLCERLQREPEADLVQRTCSVLSSAGVHIDK